MTVSLSTATPIGLMSGAMVLISGELTEAAIHNASHSESGVIFPQGVGAAGLPSAGKPGGLASIPGIHGSLAIFTTIEACDLHNTEICAQVQLHRPII